MGFFLCRRNILVFLFHINTIVLLMLAYFSILDWLFFQRPSVGRALPTIWMWCLLVWNCWTHHAGHTCFWSCILYASMGDWQERTCFLGHDNANNPACHNNSVFVSRRSSYPGKVGLSFCILVSCPHCSCNNEDDLYLFTWKSFFPSSILGGVIMVGGLYSVLWAKRSEHVDVRKQQMAAPAEAAEV